MAKLSEKEQATLKSLQAKAEAPDEPPIGRSVSVNVDLGDPKQVELAIKHGFLTADEIEDLEDDSDDKEDKDEAPKRRGFFPEGGDK